MRVLLAAVLFASSTPALSAVWREAETTHFKIISAGDEKGLLKFAKRLEQFHTLLRLATGANEVNKPAVKVRVYLVSSIGDVQRLFGNSNSNVAGFYGPREEGAFAVVPRSTGDDIFTGQLVLFHEYAHHYMLQYTPAAYPSWYVEGFAEIASTASFERAGAITFGKAASHRQHELESGTNYPVTKMLDGTYLKDRAKGRGWSYGDAWALSHYLTFTDKRRGQFRSYLNGINNGKKMPEAAVVFGDLNVLQREVSSYLAGRSFPYRAVPIQEGAEGPVKLREMGLAEAALIDMNIEFERRIELPTKAKDEANPIYERKLAKAKQDRGDWIEKIEAIANRFGGDPAGWLMLSDVRCTIAEFQACKAAADRVLVIVPGNARALARKAEAIMGQAVDLPHDQRKARVLAAQDLLLKANAADPNDPVALFLYYKSFGKMGVGADADGLHALLTTVQLVPQLAGPRLILAQEFMQRGRLLDARTILRPLAYSPHENAASLHARALLDEIEGKLGNS